MGKVRRAGMSTAKTLGNGAIAIRTQCERNAMAMLERKGKEYIRENKTEYIATAKKHPRKKSEKI